MVEAAVGSVPTQTMLRVGRVVQDNQHAAHCGIAVEGRECVRVPRYLF